MAGDDHDEQHDDYQQALAAIAQIAKSEPYEAVAQHYITLIGHAPHRVEAYQAFAIYAGLSGQAATAQFVIDEALKFDAHNARNWRLKARLYDEELDFAHSIDCWQRSLDIDPSDTQSRFNLGLAQLSLGDFAQGAVNYRYRLTPEQTAPWRGLPLWNGNETMDDGDRSGRLASHRKPDGRLRALIWAEQGLGDEIMFARLLPCLAAFEDKWHFTLQCDRRLLSTFKLNFPTLDYVSRADTAPDPREFDAQMPIGELFTLFHAQLQQPEVRDRVLRPVSRPDVAAHFATKAGAATGAPDRLNIGLSWLSMSAEYGPRRSLPIDALLNALAPAQHRLVDLQYLAPPEHVKLIRDRGFELVQAVDCYEDIEGLAALISHCDAVVTIDNSTLHLAGAMGCRTVAFIPRLANWRWGRDDPDSIWYSSLKFLRQRKQFGWMQELTDLQM